MATDHRGGGGNFFAEKRERASHAGHKAGQCSGGNFAEDCERGIPAVFSDEHPKFCGGER